MIIFGALYELIDGIKYTETYFSVMPQTIMQSCLRISTDEGNYIIYNIRNALESSRFVGLFLYLNYKCECKFTTYDHTLTRVRCEERKEYIVDSYIFYRMAGIRIYEEEKLNKFCDSNHKNTVNGY